MPPLPRQPEYFRLATDDSVVTVSTSDISVQALIGIRFCSEVRKGGLHVVNLALNDADSLQFRFTRRMALWKVVIYVATMLGLAALVTLATFLCIRILLVVSNSISLNMVKVVNMVAALFLAILGRHYPPPAAYADLL
jgi:hypothetical protein